MEPIVEVTACPTCGSGPWIEWPGGDQPLQGSVLIEFEQRNGLRYTGRAGECYWPHDGDGVQDGDSDIMRYRLASPPTDLKADNAALVAERDEADRRAGAAERRVAHLEESEARRSQWLHKAKVDAGYSHTVSFDVVWAEALEALQAQRALQATEPRP